MSEVPSVHSLSLVSRDRPSWIRGSCRTSGILSGTKRSADSHRNFENGKENLSDAPGEW